MKIDTEKKRAVEGYFNAVAAGDADTMLSFISPDFTHEFIGSTAFAAKKRNVADNLALLADFQNALVAPGKFTVTEIVEEGDTVAVMFKGEFGLVSGKRYDSVYAAMIYFTDGKISHIRELMDTKLADAVMA